MPIELTDTSKMTTAAIVATLSHIIYVRAMHFDFPDNELETMRKLIDELEYRLVIAPELEPTNLKVKDGN